MPFDSQQIAKTHSCFVVRTTTGPKEDRHEKVISTYN
jgi:hypothetical protein